MMLSPIYIDNRRGSSNLPPFLRSDGVEVVEGRYAGDFEFLGLTPFGFTPIGGEHKSCVTGDIYTSMSDGRLVGTQLPALVNAYPWRRYLIIEGNTRRGGDGILELSTDHGKHWRSAHSRNGKGWTYAEFRNRLDSIVDAFSAPSVSGQTVIVETYDIYESAAFIADRARYWSKPYDEHESAKAWDRSRAHDAMSLNPMLPTTKDQPLVLKWARDLNSVGAKRAAFAAQHFKTPIQLALGTVEEWRAIEFIEKTRKTHFSEATAQKIINEIWGRR